MEMEKDHCKLYSCIKKFGVDTVTKRCFNAKKKLFICTIKGSVRNTAGEQNKRVKGRCGSGNPSVLELNAKAH